MKRQLFFCLLMVCQLTGFTGMGALASDAKVGTPKADMEVTPLGSAAYSIDIECPPGILDMVPRVSLAYDSHYGYGIAGYGFGISGLSAITRGTKTACQDNVQRGVKYDNLDALYLDGKRLILYSGTEGADGSVYVVEGSPFTTVKRHVESATFHWFEVDAQDGKTRKYGYDGNSRNTFPDSQNNTVTASWHLSSVDDVNGNYILYSYETVDYSIRPQTITYGLNRTQSGGTESTVNFIYESHDCGYVFAIGCRQGRIDYRLKEVCSKTGNSIYRRYVLAYNTLLDKSRRKFPRLVSVTERNGSYGAMNPVTIEWQGNPTLTFAWEGMGTRSFNAFPNVESQGKAFTSSDVTGDGIDDVICMSSDKITLADYPNYHEYSYSTRLYINRSQAGTDGHVSYQNPVVYDLGAGLDSEDLRNYISLASPINNDGDGYGDLVIPTYKQINQVRKACFYILWGKSVKQGSNTYGYIISSTLTDTETVPPYAVIDADGDGKEEILYFERNSAGQCTAKLLRSHQPSDGLTEVQWSLGTVPEIKRVFCCDCNNDGLRDLLFLGTSGYTVFYNNGGSGGSGIFSSTNKSTGTNLSEAAQMKLGDVNGDNLLDIVYTRNGERKVYFAVNNGNGTFSVSEAFTSSGVLCEEDTHTLFVSDHDKDGLSDVILAATNGWNMSKQKMVYLASDGSHLYERASFDIPTSDPSLLMCGLFSGNDVAELALFGNMHSVSASYPDSDTLTVKKICSSSPSDGRVTGITDALGRQREISYAHATSPSVYTPQNDGLFPLADFTLPLCVVDAFSDSNGAAGSTTTNYHYGGLKGHVAGRGLLGFSLMTACEDMSGDSVTKETQWNSDYGVPAMTSVSESVGNYTITQVQNYGFATMRNSYFHYPSELVKSDTAGDSVRVTSIYNLSNGQLASSTSVYNGDSDMMKQELRSGFVYKGKRYLPTTITRRQKHRDDESLHEDVTTMTYDDYGRTTEEVRHSGTPMALTTRYSYLTFGNRHSASTSGSQTPNARKTWNWDSTGRFVVRKYQVPFMVDMAYTYDQWGNILTATDQTDSSSPLTTHYYYDLWGTNTSVHHPDGRVETRSEGHGATAAKRYYVTTDKTGEQPVTTWYDECGREVLQESWEKGAEVEKILVYNRHGQVETATTSIGNLTLTETYDYDARHRLIRESSSTGRQTTYAYSTRQVDIDTNGRLVTKHYDEWGNTQSVTDSLSTIEYSYYSSGLPATATVNGETTLSMQYDAAGNRTSLTDPDAGTTTSTYAADGRLLSRTDARGITTSYGYDTKRRLTSVSMGSTTVNYTYGTSGSAKLRLVRAQSAGGTIDYTYDPYGRLATETRTPAGGSPLSFGYTYANGLPQSISYPGGLTVSYAYDTADNGVLTEITANGTPLFSQGTYDGLRDSCLLLNVVSHATKLNVNGYLSGKSWSTGTKDELMSFGYDSARGNLLTRSFQTQKQLTPSLSTLSSITPIQPTYGDSFSYDGLDRLTQAVYNGVTTENYSYADNGNILSKTKIGLYDYDDTAHPHAVTGVENTHGLITSGTLHTLFGSMGKVVSLEDEGTGYHLDITYGPDMERWQSLLTQGDSTLRTTLYAGDYERVEEGGVTREFYYLPHDIVAVKQNGAFSFYIALKDNLGSIRALSDGSLTRVFSAKYDAWGQPTITSNSVGLRRGYCSHEMLPEFGVINMNGRIYDPLLGRFLSPDNYVQLPDDSQSFNRYSYCLNNPLKYTDPDGEVIIVDDLLYITIGAAVIGGFVNLGLKAYNGQINSFWDGFAAFGIGAVAGAAGGLTGAWGFAAVGGAAGGAGGFLAGAVGGMLGTATSTAVESYGNHIAFGDPMISTSDFAFAVALGGAIGGAANGFAAISNGRNFWTGDITGTSVNTYTYPTHTTVEGPSDRLVDQYPTPEYVTAETMKSPYYPQGTGTYSAYYGTDSEGIVRYVGITKRDPYLRFSEHLHSGTQKALLDYYFIKDTGNLSFMQARVIEQNLINTYQLQQYNGLLFNKINSISPRYWNRWGIVRNGLSVSIIIEF